METIRSEYVERRVYETTVQRSGDATLRLADRVVDLGSREYDAYTKVVAWLSTSRPVSELGKELSLAPERVGSFVAAFADAGLFHRPACAPPTCTGKELHARFAALLPTWLSEAFSHPFWARMLEGRGSKRLFAGWMIELYHYTRNANRHMPLSCVQTRDKRLKLLRAKHYAEEWNHYHYFTKSLKALGYSDAEVARSEPLPMTLALSNFMRQAAREDILAYSICSAVLEGTTTDKRSYDSYYETAARLYDIPREAIAPIYAHLDLDVQYQHSDLFLEILEGVDSIPVERQERILQYGHQLAELIWSWTDCIERYYQDDSKPMPRHPFDPFVD
jgi:pyrroloquinoline quinone (PQQ) biosynthesis protein C